MATVHFGRLIGPAGFSRVVAIKRLHQNFAKDPDCVAMIFDEARIAARVRHPNVVATLDVVATSSETFLVMEYVHGESLARLWRATQAAGKCVEPRVVAAVMSGVLHGLHAAHEATGERGDTLDVVHRDVSPQNILVGADGVARLLDFGVARAKGRLQTTREGRVKGKLAYMPPEQFDGAPVTRQADVYAAAVVTWELLTGQRAFGGDQESAIIAAILSRPLLLPSKVAQHVPAAFDDVVARGMQRDPALRYATAREMAFDLERCVGVASMTEVFEWVQSNAQADLTRRALRIAAIELGQNADGTDGAPSALTHEEPTKRLGQGAKAPGSDGTTEGSGIAVPPAPVGVRQSRRRRLAVVVSACTATLFAVVLLVRTIPSSRRGPHGPSAPSDTPATVTPVRIDLDGTTDLVAPRWAPAAETPSAPAASGSDHRAAASPRASHASGGPARPPNKMKSECDPPFTTDEFGHKHYAAACLE
jgi:eukaryotic-like serine/threonine-protein kinase